MVGSTSVDVESRELRGIDEFTQGAPLIVVGDCDCNPFVVACRWENGVRGVDGVAVTHSIPQTTVDGPVQKKRGELLHGRFTLTEVDVLPLTCCPVVFDSSHDATHKKAGGNVVGVSPERATWCPIGPAGRFKKS